MSVAAMAAVSARLAAPSCPPWQGSQSLDVHQGFPRTTAAASTGGQGLARCRSCGCDDVDVNVRFSVNVNVHANVRVDELGQQARQSQSPRCHWLAGGRSQWRTGVGAASRLSKGRSRGDQSGLASGRSRRDRVGERGRREGGGAGGGAVRVRCLAGEIAEHLPLVLGVGVGLPCTVMECGDVIYRSTLPAGDPFKLTTAGATLALLLGAYLWATPGVAPGFWDMFLLAPLEQLLRPKVTKRDLLLGKKLGEGSFGTVYKASYANPGPGKQEALVVKRANEFGAVEVWMNERVRRACPSSCADFIGGFLESTGKGTEFWLVWRYEGDATLADIIASKDFPYNAERALLGPRAARLPMGSLEREAQTLRALLTQLLASLQRLHSIGIVHRDVKPQNIIFSRETGLLKIIDLGAAADLRVGINYAPTEFLLDPRYAAPEQYIMSTQTPSAPPPPVAAALSPVLWQMNLPDRFDMYSVGLIFLQMVFPSLRSDSALIQFNRQFKRCGYDLAEWRALLTKRAAPDIVRGFEILDMDGGHGWVLLQSMLRFKGRERISAGGALAHPFFFPGDIPLFQRLRLAFLRAAYADNSELTQAFFTFMARSGTPGVGGFTEVSLQDIQAAELKKMKKDTLQRNALASALRLQRKVVRTIGATVADFQPPKKGVSWWNRWES